MSVSQKNMIFAQTYPAGRPAFFAVRFLTHLLRRGAAFAVKSDGVVLLTAVVTAEDRTKYSKPIAFWNDHLCSMTGLSRERLFEARKRCVTAGWLSYCEGAHGRAPVYFVTVPGGDAEIDASMIGESPADELVRELGREIRPNSPPMSDSIDHRSPTQSTTHSSLLPVTLTPPPHPTGKKRTEEEDSDSNIPEIWKIDVCRRLRGIGVNLAESTLTASIEEHRRKGLDVNRIVQVIQHLEDRQLVWKGKPLRPYGGGAAVRRLTDGELLELPAAEGWPKNPDPIWSREWQRELESRSRAAEAARVKVGTEPEQSSERETWRQLELQFQGELQRLSANPAELVRMLNEAGQTELARHAKKSPESTAVRRAVLRLLAGTAAGKG